MTEVACIRICVYLETKMGNIIPLPRPINYGASGGHLLDVMAKLFRPPTELGYVNQGRQVAYQKVLIFYALRGTQSALGMVDTFCGEHAF